MHFYILEINEMIGLKCNAILEFNDAVKFSNNTFPVCLPDSSSEESNLNNGKKTYRSILEISRPNLQSIFKYQISPGPTKDQLGALLHNDLNKN